MTLATPVQWSPSTVTIRALEPADIARITTLFQRHSTYRRDAAFWLWINRVWPVAPSLVSVAVVDDEVVGHYAILPMDLRLADGSGLRAGLGVHAFLSPEYRQAVNIFQISAYAYRQAQAAGLALVYGFPNAQYRLVQEKLERWRRVALFKAWTKPAMTAAVTTSARLMLADLRADEELQAALRLWEQADRTGEGVRPANCARWWQVRYLAHPQQPYQLHWLHTANGTPGLVVAKIFQTEGTARAHLVDYVLGENQTAAELLAAFEKEYAARVTQFVHWPTDAALTKALVEADYQPDGFETYFGLRALGTAAPAPALLEAAAWRLMPGLSDAF